MADYRGAGNNIYTVLAFIAFVALLFGVGFVVFRHYDVFGGNPFSTPASTAAPASLVTTDLA